MLGRLKINGILERTLLEVKEEATFVLNCKSAETIR